MLNVCGRLGWYWGGDEEVSMLRLAEELWPKVKSWRDRCVQ